MAACHRIFVAGDRSQVGKTSVCMGMLGSLLEKGYLPSELGYIKPATQCESIQLIQKYCNSVGIECIGLGPIIFYSGFTRAFLDGKTSSSAVMLCEVVAEVNTLCKGKKIVIIDGVGYPAVGSIIGLSNADIARALNCNVLLVGKRGVGDAVDSFNLNYHFFISYGVKVVGTLFNRLPNDEESYYSLDKCSRSVRKYFELYRSDIHVYGFLPELPVLTSASPVPALPSSTNGNIGPETATILRLEAKDVFMSPEEKELSDLWINTFISYIDIDLLLNDIMNTDNSLDSTTTTTSVSDVDVELSRGASSFLLNRNEIMAAAKEQGAAPGG